MNINGEPNKATVKTGAVHTLKPYFMYKYRLSILFFVSAFFLLAVSSCSKNEGNPDPGKQDVYADFIYKDELDHYTLTSTSTGSELTYQWEILTGKDPVSACSSNSGESFCFLLPDISDSSYVDIRLTIQNDQGASSVTKRLPVPPMTLARKCQSERFITNGQSNNVSYDWYINQGNTGQYSNVNCGPSCVTMAIKWVDEGFTKTPEDARNTYRSTGGWWYTSDIINYLNLHDIDNYVINLSAPTDLKTQLDAGFIAVLCLDIFYVRYALDMSLPLDKFYPTSGTGAGHFIVVKGYKIVDNHLLFEVYDPWSLGYAYNDGTPMGINRLYREEDIMHATNIWWEYAIIVQKPQAGAIKRTSAGAIIVDPGQIIHQKGG